ncbi:MAG: TetR/AcrR family transcriptional regulator [Solirubrobacterales bacterium]|nr:TetR/AcrR family transcriptional regulator [Solirubrobacterales bacterium]
MRRRTQAERRADTRARLLTAARRTFAGHGYNGTSLDRISEAAGCTKGALYDHFGSKAGLFMALLDEQFASRIEQAKLRGELRPSQAMPFDRDFALLFLEFVCAAGRDARLRRRLAAQLAELRSLSAERLGDHRLAAAVGAAANGASIEALIFGEADGAATFDLLLAALLDGQR